MTLPAILTHTLDDALAVTREQRVRAVGYVGHDIPVEFILAAGARPIRLCEQIGYDTSVADRFVEPTFSLAARQIAQRWLTGQLDALEAVVFSRGDDNAQRLYYYLCELQRTGEASGPRPLLFDIARVDRFSSVAHTVASARLLVEALDVDASALSPAASRVRQRAQLLARLNAARIAHPLPGTLSHAARRAAQYHWDEEFDRAFENWIANATAIEARHRIALIGSEAQHEAIHSAVETNGSIICHEIYETTPLPDTELTQGDAIAAIATHYHRQACAARQAFSDAARIVASARAARADGAILWLTQTDSALAWEAPHIAKALHAAGIPVLSLLLQPAASDAASLARVAHFARTLEAL
jgi:benzoyl-CoA reductase/2-hydroxyglutaryl-CoA dehydratase subunit BcrC/BadD/HgdB